MFETILAQTNWLAVILSTIGAFGFGALWYSEKLLGARWRAGIGVPAVNTTAHMYFGMVTQFCATLVLAFIVSATILLGSLMALIVIAIMLMGFIKAHGFYAGKTKTAITIEVSYILVMVLILYGVQTIFY